MPLRAGTHSSMVFVEAKGEEGCMGGVWFGRGEVDDNGWKEALR